MVRNFVINNVEMDEITRLVKVIESLTEGSRILFEDGTKIGMGEDFSIGFIVNIDNVDHIGGLSTIDLKELNILLNKKTFKLI